MNTPLHLALGDSAAGCLREACRSHGMPGAVAVIPDDLSHGPLDDGVSRLEYLHACYEGYDEWRFAATDAFAPWRAWLHQLERAPSAAPVIWSGPNASEALLLAMACWWLRDRGRPVLSVSVPTAEGRHHVATRTPGELADLFGERQALTPTDRAALAADFERVRDDPRPRRRWEHGRVVAAPVDCFDQRLLDVCTMVWQPAARLVGTAMARTDSRHSVSDLFYCSRLQVLILDGRIEADGPRRRLGEYSVRLAETR
jgi:hypothetical protein